MMKKILILLSAAFAAASCFSKGSYSQTYMADVTFEFSDQVYANSFKDSLYIMKEGEGEGFLYMQYPLFFSQKVLSGSFQGGFLMSYLKGEKDNLLERPAQENDAYRVHAASGALGSKTYAVFYDNPDKTMMPLDDIEFAYKDMGIFSPYGCYVNNTTLVARKIKEHFVEGDKLVLKAKGIRHNGETVQTSITLAEYTGTKDTVMYNWSVFDLQPLGNVDFVDFEVESTNPAVPGYFCMDGFVGKIKVEY